MDTDKMQQTQKFAIASERNKVVSGVFSKVKAAMEEKGYNPVNQIVGYLMSGDPTYITSHNDARNIIRKVDRDELIEEIVSFYLKEL